jgi:hypothetical protein
MLVFRGLLRVPAYFHVHTHWEPIAATFFAFKAGDQDCPFSSAAA